MPTQWTHHPRIPAGETLRIFVLSKCGLYSTSAIVRCMQYRVMLNNVITRLGYIMQHSDWCTLRPRDKMTAILQDAVRKFIFLNRFFLFTFYWNTNVLCCQESNWYSTTICKLVDLIPALHQSDCRIPNWASAKTVLSCSTNHGQTTARFRSFFR